MKARIDLHVWIRETAIAMEALAASSGWILQLGDELAAANPEPMADEQLGLAFADSGHRVPNQETSAPAQSTQDEEIGRDAESGGPAGLPPRRLDRCDRCGSNGEEKPGQRVFFRRYAGPLLCVDCERVVPR